MLGCPVAMLHSLSFLSLHTAEGYFSWIQRARIFRKHVKGALWRKHCAPVSKATEWDSSWNMILFEMSLYVIQGEIAKRFYQEAQKRSSCTIKYHNFTIFLKKFSTVMLWCCLKYHGIFQKYHGIWYHHCTMIPP